MPAFCTMRADRMFVRPRDSAPCDSITSGLGRVVRVGDYASVWGRGLDVESGGGGGVSL